MSWLTGKQIEIEVKRGKIKIDPYYEDQLNPNSYDYRLAPYLRRLLPNSKRGGISCLDPKKDMKFEEIKIPKSGFLMRLGQAYLGYTIEKLGSDHFASLVTGKSSIGRLFINNHVCAGLIDQGFYNHITLEITVTMPTMLYPNMRFGQIFWFESVGEAKLYQGRYQGENRATPSRIHLDFSAK